MLGRILLWAMLSAVHAVRAQDAPAVPHPAVDRPTQSAANPADVLRLLLLREKCAELDRLQHEVAELQAAAGTAPSILVRVQLIEVALTKLREKGVDTDWFAKGFLDAAPAAEPELGGPSNPSNDVLRFVEGLKQNNLAKVIAEPSLPVTNGRPASFFSGGEIPVAANNDSKAAVDVRRFGTEVDIQALALGNNQVRLTLRTRLSNLAPSHDEAPTPRLDVCQCDSTVELSLGQSAMLTGNVTQRTEAVRNSDGQLAEKLVQIGTMLVVTAEELDSSTPATASVSGPDEKRK